MTFINLVVTLFVMTSLSTMTSSAKKYVAEVRVYVDAGAEQRWQRQTGKTGEDEFRSSLLTTFIEVNQVLKSLKDNGVDLQLQVEDIIFLNENILNTNNGQISGTPARQQFIARIKQSYDKKPYDFAVLYTGAQLIGAYGVATLGVVCTTESVAVVQYDWDYMNALLTAHEIGHMMGSNHDGDPTSSSCPWSSGHVMNSQVDPDKPNHFYFSSCSAASIKKTLEGLDKEGKNCMVKWDKEGTLTGPHMGQVMDPDALCKRAQGEHSYLARNYIDKNTCLYLQCMVDASRFYRKFEATPQGLNCGKNKQCIHGKCVKTSGGSADVSDMCPFGEQPILEDGRTCSDMKSADCARPEYKKLCCHTCVGNPDDVCRQLEGPKSSLGRLYYKTYALVYMKENKVCQDSKCVKSALGDPTMPDKCIVGDQPWLGKLIKSKCYEYTRQYGCDGFNKRMADMCCLSCSEGPTADEVCRQRLGAGSALARIAYQGYYGDEMCSQLTCLSWLGQTGGYGGSSMRAPDRMTCGKNKKCQDGRCVDNKTGDPNALDSCPWGDQPYQDGLWTKSCKDVDCGKYKQRYTCCSTCHGK